MNRSIRGFFIRPEAHRHPHHALRSNWMGSVVTIMMVLLGAFVSADSQGAADPDLTAESQTGRPVTIDCIRIKPRSVFNHFEFRRLSSLRPPEDVSPLEIARTADNLMKTGRFSDVTWEIVDARCGRQLVFTCTMNSFIKKLTFTGNRQIGDSALRQASRLRKFGPFSGELLESSLGQFRDYYVSQGYPEPELKAVMRGPNSEGEVGIEINVKEKALPRPESIDFNLSGHPGIWWKIRLRTVCRYLEWRISRHGLNLVDLNNRLQTEQRKLRDNGYRNAAVSIEPISSDTDGTPELSVSVDPGKPVRIRFRNVGFFTRRDILQEWESRSATLTGSEVERLADQTREVLRNAGWIDADVTSEIIEHDTYTEVVLKAEPGLRRHIGGVIRNGESPVSVSELERAGGLRPPRLLGLLKIRPGPATLRDAASGIRTYLENEGYARPDVSIDIEKSDSKAVTAIATIRPGTRQMLGSVGFSGADNTGVSDLKKLIGHRGIKTGEPFVNRFIRDAMTDITRHYWKLGYSDMTIRAVPRRTESGTDLTFEITEGPAYRQGPLIVSGNVKTRSSLIYRLEKISSGQPFELQKIGRLQEAMYQTGIFDTVTIRTEKHPEAATPFQTVIMEVTERSTGEFETGIDFNTDRGFEGIVEVGERNLFGRALQGRLSGLLGEERWTAAANLQRPVFWGYRLENRFRTVYTDDRTNSGYDLRSITLEMGVVKRWRNDISFNIAYAYEREDVLNILPDISQAIEIGNTRSASLTPVFTIDRRDDPFRTGRGWLYQTRLKNSLDLLGTESEFIRWDHDARIFIPIDRDRIVLGLALRAGRSWVLEDSVLPAGERFYLGGASTNRGFEHQMCGPRSDDDNPLGGESFILGNIEARFHLAGNLKGAIFVDAGNVFASSPETPYLRPSAGIGLRYSTPIGPIRCDVGWNLDRQDGEPGYAVQIALGHAF